MSEVPTRSQAFVSSRLDGFRHFEPKDRLATLTKMAGLSSADQIALGGIDALPVELANGMIENVIGKFEIPLGVATNFTVNGRDCSWLWGVL